MSLTSKIKEASSKRFQASDGIFYALQKVNSTKMIIDQGNIADLMTLKGNAGDLEQMMMVDPTSASKAVKVAMQMKPDFVRAGLIGEFDEQGNLKLFRWVDKPAVLLEDGEVNINLIPDALLEEFFEAIGELSPKAPSVQDDVIQTFPAI